MVRVVFRRPTADQRESRVGKTVGLLVGIDLFLNGMAAYVPLRWMGAVWILGALGVGLLGQRIEIYKLRRDRLRGR